MIAVLGATGRIGRHLCAGLAERNLVARAVVRDPASAPARALPLPATAADLRDPATLRRAFDGAEQLLLLTPHDPDQDLREAAAIAAAQAVGVRRVVKVSGAAATLGPNGTTSTAVGHWRTEQLIERSGLGFQFLRPSFLMQNLLDAIAATVARTGLLLAPMGRGQIAMVDARDVAGCAVALLADATVPDGAWSITGPRAVGFDAVATGLDVPYLAVPPAAARRALRRGGSPAFEVEHALRMAAHFAAGAEASTSDAVRHLTGRAPRTLAAFLDEHAGAFAGKRIRGLRAALDALPLTKGH
jgi:NAD(P)H dehydrogenase (quinone)